MGHLRRMPDSVGFWPSTLPRGLYPMFISPETGQWMSPELTLGARADSLYEYLLKQWLLSGRKLPPLTRHVSLASCPWPLLRRMHTHARRVPASAQ